MAHNVKFSSIAEIDLSKLERPQVAVFNDLKEYLEKAVAKIMDNGQKTNMIIISDNLTSLCKDIRQHTNLTFGWRGKDDVPELVGAFF